MIHTEAIKKTWWPVTWLTKERQSCHDRRPWAPKTFHPTEGGFLRRLWEDTVIYVNAIVEVVDLSEREVCLTFESGLVAIQTFSSRERKDGFLVELEEAGKRVEDGQDDSGGAAGVA
jgi:hypothetical protein